MNGVHLRVKCNRCKKKIDTTKNEPVVMVTIVGPTGWRKVPMCPRCHKDFLSEEKERNARIQRRTRGGIWLP